MKSWDDCLLDCQDLASDYTSTSLTIFKRIMNTGYKFVLSQLGRTVTEVTRTASTVASQQWYQMPPDYLFLKSVTITVGGIPCPVFEEESQESWDVLNASTTQTSDIPQFYFLRPSFGVSQYEIGFWPTPSSAGNTITMVCEATDKDLGQTAYTTGTVSASNNSANVTGSGTTFISTMVGRYFKVDEPTGDGLWYKIITYSSATAIVLGNNYQGGSVSGASYHIAEMFSLPEEMQILPVYFALWHYFILKKDTTSAKQHQQWFEDGIALGMRRHATKSRSSIVKGKRWLGRWRSALPLYFPTSVSS